MKIYITRHGQVDTNAAYFDGTLSLPQGEVPLSELGKKQAWLLSQRMKELNFHGKIYASPLFRAMETAEIVAKETGSCIVPTPWFQEIFMDQDMIDTFRGCSIEELRNYFSHIAEEARMEKVWWVTKAETGATVYERVSKGLAQYLEEESEDILLVGHGASVGAAHDYLNLGERGFIWNCSIGLYDTENPEHNYGNDVGYLPKDLISDNCVMGIDIGFDNRIKKTGERKDGNTGSTKLYKRI